MADGSGRTVTQRVDPGELRSLDDSARAAVAFTTTDGPEAVPVVVLRRGHGLLVGTPPGSVPDPPPPRPVLLVDDGRWWFELRAVVRRGSLSPAEGPDPDLDWFAVEVGRTVAWDYGRLHEELPE